jgi:hypothetical protein
MCRMYSHCYKRINVVTVKLYNCTLEVLGSNLGRTASYPDCSFIWFRSALREISG